MSNNINNKDEFNVTPWDVTGEVNYQKLIAKFGTKEITQNLLDQFKRITGEVHPLLNRKIFFSHRDLDLILNNYEKGQEFCLYTGRGPSGNTHIGHLLAWKFTQYLQEKFDVELYFQMTDDEKYLHIPNMTLKQTLGYTYENVLDIIAMGFDSKKTHIFSDIEYAITMYRIAVEIAKHITFSTTKAVFGFKGSTNIGMVFFPALQAATCFLPSILKNKKNPCLIPAAIDQDPYWRGIARFVAPKINLPKPAQIHAKFLPGLGKGGKMSSSNPNTAVFTTDDVDVAEKKIKNSYTGGRDTIAEQKRLGGRPDICPIYDYYKFLFEYDDSKLKNIYQDCKSGKLLCGDCKAHLGNKVKIFLKDHQRKREKAKNVVEKFMLRD